MTRTIRLLSAVSLSVTLVASACSSGPDKAAKPKVVTLVTYESFALPKTASDAFTKKTGAKLRVVKAGDAAEMLTKALLSAGAPEGDVIFGIDNLLATRALTGGLLDRVAESGRESIQSKFLPGGDTDDYLVPIDHGEVCMNIDAAWFKGQGIDPPTELADLTDARFKSMTVISSPVTSTPGLAFLVGTVAVMGNSGWQDYWRKLKDNDILVRPSWSDAYYGDYTVSGGKRPVVLSYASSPPAEVIFSEGKRTEPVSTVMTSSCVQQIEYAGILKGTKVPELAQQLVDFMASADWQSELPLTNFVYPVTDVELPDEFSKWAPPIADPIKVDSNKVDDNRDTWIEQWRQIME